MRKILLGLVVAVGMIVMTTTVFGQTNLTVVRHADNTIWAMLCEGLTCSSWTKITGGFSTQPTLTWDPALNKYILIGIGNNGSNIWRSTFNADGTWNHDWALIGTGATGSPSPVAVTGGAFRAFFPKRVAIVSPEGGNYTNPVDAMNDVTSWCNVYLEDRCLLKIMPGFYEVGTNKIQMWSYVDIEGSGESVTTIRGTRSGADYCNAEAALVIGATGAEIRSLSLWNEGRTGTYAVGLLNNSQSSPKITNVSIVVSSNNSAYVYGIVNCPGSPQLLNVDVTAQVGSLINRAIYNSSWSNVQMMNVVAHALGGVYADGIRNEESGIWMRSSVAIGEGASIGSYGLSNANTKTPGYLTTVENSRLRGETHAIFNGSNGPGIYVANSELDFGVDNTGFLKCVGAYTQLFDPLNSSCQ